MMANINQILKAKEMLAIEKHKLAQSTNLPVISVQANYPGSDKSNGFSFYVVSIFEEWINKQFKITHQARFFNELGFVVLLVVDKDPIKCKEELITVETMHPCGRLVDLDVFVDNRPISRSDLNQAERACLVCESVARVCMIEQTHTTNQLQQAFNTIVIHHIKDKPEEVIRFALLSECSLDPKFGLVTPFSQGVHEDMNIETFLSSISTLIPYFKLVQRINTNQLTEEIFTQLRTLGKTMEQAMFKATNGVNTHKGAIFLFLMVLMAQRLAGDYQPLDQMLRLLSQPVLKDFYLIDPTVPLTDGQQQYLDYKTMGIRGFVLAGGEPILSKALDFIQAHPTNHDHLIKTLLLIMSELEDSTIIKKVGLDGLAKFQQQAKLALDHPDKWEQFNQYCINHQLSAGGAADILAVVIYLSITQLERAIL